MIDQNTIGCFIPAQAIEHPNNSEDGATLKDKIKKCVRRYYEHEEFTDGPITDKSRAIIVEKFTLDPKQLGYTVVARINIY